MAYDHADQHPPRPFVLPEDYPSPTDAGRVEEELKAKWRQEHAEAHPSIEFEFARSEREELYQRQLGSTVGGPYPVTPLGPLSPREAQREVDYEEAFRRHAGGLPDSAEDMPPVAVVGGPPARFGGD